jgi:hypothetical protein
MRNKYFDQDVNHVYFIIRPDIVKYSSITNEASGQKSRQGHRTSISNCHQLCLQTEQVLHRIRTLVTKVANFSFYFLQHPLIGKGKVVPVLN